jgi:hypothetical protein
MERAVEVHSQKRPPELSKVNLQDACNCNTKKTRYSPVVLTYAVEMKVTSILSPPSRSAVVGLLIGMLHPCLCRSLPSVQALQGRLCPFPFPP